MQKRLLGFMAVLLVSILFVGVAIASAASHIKIIVNGQEIKPNIQPMLVKDTTMVPVRAIAESLGADVKWNAAASSVTITSKDKISKAVASISDAGVILSAVEKDGMYEDFTLEVRGSKRFFDWENVSNPTYAPELLLNDINRDGQEELIVILTTDYGTGVHITEAHIINPETLVETYIDNPKAIVLKNVKTTMTVNEVTIATGDQKTVIEKHELNIEPAHIFPNIGFGSICTFEVINNELRANMGAQISPASFIGELQISYIFKDNMYQASKVEFIKYSN